MLTRTLSEALWGLALMTALGAGAASVTLAAVEVKLWRKRRAERRSTAEYFAALDDQDVIDLSEYGVGSDRRHDVHHHQGA